MKRYTLPDENDRNYAAYFSLIPDTDEFIGECEYCDGYIVRDYGGEVVACSFGIGCSTDEPWSIRSRWDSLKAEGLLR